MRGLGAPYQSGFNELDVAFNAVKTLPENLKDLVISLWFDDDWWKGREFIARMDSLLAARNDVTTVEVIPEDPTHREELQMAFPELSGQQKLRVKRSSSEALQVFDE